MQPMLNIAVRAAARAGDIIVRNLDRVPSLNVQSKGRNDFVSEIDHMAERDIIETVRRMHPDTDFSARNPGAAAATNSYGSSIRSTAPPISCTASRSLPCRSRSNIAGRLEHAVVYDPMRQELVHRIPRRWRTARRPSHSRQQAVALEGALIATGFPYRANARWIDEYMSMLKSVMRSRGGHPASRRCVARSRVCLRRAASMATGRSGLSPWDTAAGTLLILEAGGRVGTLTGEPYAQGGHIVAGTPKVFDALVGCISPYVPASLREA
jgi:myo-inositol-1(or 4)-monophosphatase